MKWLLKVFFLFPKLIFFIEYFEEAFMNDYKIVIDPGHGGIG